MDDVANLPGIKPIELVHVQRVRLFLGVTTQSRHFKPVFPRQERPRAANVIETWKRVKRLCYSQAASAVLDNPLGPWHQGCVNQVWNTVIDPKTGLLYVWDIGRVSLYEQRSRYWYRYVRILNVSMFPPKASHSQGTSRLASSPVAMHRW
jgi:hypothetical protein